MQRHPRLLVISHVYPFPRQSGQQQRVFYKLKALRPFFHVTFLTFARPERTEEVSEKLSALCDDVILLPSRYAGSRPYRLWRQAASKLYALRTGLKRSNYFIGQLEFAPARMEELLQKLHFDCALFEYWHAAATVPLFQRKGIPCVLDMHNILWQSYSRQLAAKSALPLWWQRWAVARYQAHEERAWQCFDALIAINAGEHHYTRSVGGDSMPIFLAPMGTDLDHWPYAWQPTRPPRLAYYGGLGSPHNQRDALACYEQLMPLVWRECPQAELWLVGSNPPPSLQALARDKRVRVTGFVERVQDVLKTMSVVVCPWSGTYGFRSRLVEVMSLGVPVVASPEAVYGMPMEPGRGIFLEESYSQMAQTCLNLIRDPVLARQQSQLARHQVEAKFSYEATYGQLARDLSDFVCRTKQPEPAPATTE